MSDAVKIAAIAAASAIVIAGFATGNGGILFSLAVTMVIGWMVVSSQ